MTDPQEPNLEELIDLSQEATLKKLKALLDVAFMDGLVPLKVVKHEARDFVQITDSLGTPLMREEGYDPDEARFIVAAVNLLGSIAAVNLLGSIIARIERQQKRIEELETALRSEAAMIEEAQNYCRMYLEPGETSIVEDSDLVNKIIYLFDGPERRASLELRRKALSTEASDD